MINDKIFILGWSISLKPELWTKRFLYVYSLTPYCVPDACSGQSSESPPSATHADWSALWASGLSCARTPEEEEIKTIYMGMEAKTC